ncbi:unnamed protein product, partial [Prorocentrum cordatum]
MTENGHVPSGMTAERLLKCGYEVPVINDFAYRDNGVWQLVSGRTLANVRRLPVISHLNYSGRCVEVSVRESASRGDSQATVSIIATGKAVPFSHEQVAHAGGEMPLQHDASLSAICACVGGVIARRTRVRESGSLRIHRGSIALQLGMITLDQTAFRARWERLSRCLVGITADTTPLARIGTTTAFLLAEMSSVADVGRPLWAESTRRGHCGLTSDASGKEVLAQVGQAEVHVTVASNGDDATARADPAAKGQRRAAVDADGIYRPSAALLESDEIGPRGTQLARLVFRRATCGLQCGDDAVITGLARGCRFAACEQVREGRQHGEHGTVAAAVFTPLRSVGANARNLARLALQRTSTEGTNADPSHYTQSFCEATGRVKQTLLGALMTQGPRLKRATGYDPLQAENMERWVSESTRRGLEERPMTSDLKLRRQPVRRKRYARWDLNWDKEPDGSDVESESSWDSLDEH